MRASPMGQLQTFVAVAQRGSFSAAARELGVTPSAVSQAVKQLEDQLGVALLTRTTRSVAVTDAGRRLLARAGPALGEAASALREVAAAPGEIVGRVRLTVPRAAVPVVIAPVLPVFRERHPRVDVEVVVDDRLVDLVAEGFDAGVRLSESIERDMVQARLTEPFRFVVVGAPGYLARRPAPQRPEDLLEHECLGFRMARTGELYAWEFERGRRTWRIPVSGGLVVNDGPLRLDLAERGVGLAYVAEPQAAAALADGRLLAVLESYACTVPGFFLYYPSRSQTSPTLRLFINVAREHASSLFVRTEKAR